MQKSVKFEVADVIKDELLDANWVPKNSAEGVPVGFDVVLDKGTYDAISLSEETLADGRRVYEDYPRKVAAVVKTGGLLVVTSCNWTEEELQKKMLAEKSEDPQQNARVSCHEAHEPHRSEAAWASEVSDILIWREDRTNNMYGLFPENIAPVGYYPHHFHLLSFYIHQLFVTVFLTRRKAIVSHLRMC